MTKTTTEPTPATWTHKGVEIRFIDKNATFTAVISGKHQSFPSLDAAKKKIDTIKASGFVPFTALEFSYYIPRHSGELRERKPTVVHATGIAKQPRYDRWQFEIKRELVKGQFGRGEDIAQVLHPDTPECRAAYDDYMALCIKNLELKEAMDKAENEAKRLIPVIDADDYHNAGKLVIVIPADRAVES